MGIDILGIDIMGVDILGIDIPYNLGVVFFFPLRPAEYHIKFHAF